MTDGERRWERDLQDHVDTSGGESRSRKASGFGAVHTNLDRHFNPGQVRRFLQELTLQAVGTVRTAGRECVRVRAVLRPEGSLWPHWLPKGADEYEFHLDLERGALLNVISRRGGEAFSAYEVLEVTFDEPLDPDLFTYTPAAGEQVGPKVPAVEQMTLAAAVERMPFTVLIPTRVPDPQHANFEVMYHPPHREGPWPHLALMYRANGAYQRLWVDQAERPDPNLAALEWERVVVEGEVQKDLRISDPGTTTGTRIVAFEQQGTHVRIRSDLDRARLLELALSFAAAPGTVTP